jgi:chorismate lyase/3-hydroxybenzoate synthase
MAATQALSHRREPFVLPVDDARLPIWVGEMRGLAATTPAEAARDTFTLRLAAGDSFSRIEISFGDVPAMDILTFQQTVAEAYRNVFDLLDRMPTPYPVRFWAFIPDIHADMGAGLDRYMAFNAGRFAAYSARYGGRQGLSRSVATGSAIGFGQERLVLHCLAGAEPGAPIENPRQVPAYNYSRRYGPLPPCFARATRIADRHGEGHRLLVGGTASIRGEDSLHVTDLGGQVRETLANLASLVRFACGGDQAKDGDAALEAWLPRFRELRIYRPRRADADRILDLVLPGFTGVSRVELLEAELCRAELLVELEGVAEITGGLPGRAA